MKRKIIDVIAIMAVAFGGGLIAMSTWHRPAAAQQLTGIVSATEKITIGKGELVINEAPACCDCTGIIDTESAGTVGALALKMTGCTRCTSCAPDAGGTTVRWTKP